MAYDAGNAHLQVIPSFRNWEDLVRKELSKLGKQVGESFDDALSKSAGTGIRGAVRKSADGIVRDSERLGGRAGESAGDKFGTTFERVTQRRVVAMLDSLSEHPSFDKIRNALAGVLGDWKDGTIGEDKFLERLGRIERGLRRVRAEAPAASVFDEANRALTQVGNIGDIVRAFRQRGFAAGDAFNTAMQNRLGAVKRLLPDNQVGLDRPDGEQAQATGAERQLAVIRQRATEAMDLRIGVDIDEASLLAELATIQGLLEEFASSVPSIQLEVAADAAAEQLANFWDDIKTGSERAAEQQQALDDKVAAERVDSARKEIAARERLAEQARNREFEAARKAVVREEQAAAAARGKVAEQFARGRERARAQVAAQELREREQAERQAAQAAQRVVEQAERERERTVRAFRERRVKEDREAFERTFAGRSSAGLQAAGASITPMPVMQLRIDAAPARAELEQVRQSIHRLGDERVGVTIDVNDFLGRVEADFARLRALARDVDVDIDVRVDAARAATELGGILVLAGRLDHDDAEIKVDVDAAGALVALAALRSALDVHLGRLGLLIAVGASIGTSIVPAAAAAASAIGAIGTAAAAAGIGIGVMMLGFSGVGDAVKALQKADEDSAESAKSLVSAHNAVANAVDGVRSAQQNLVNTRASNADGAIRAEQAVQSALKGVSAAQRDVGRAVRDVADARMQASRSVADAEKSAQDALRGVVQAQRDVARAVRDVADARRQAARSVEDAEQRLADTQLQATRAVIDARRAQEDLTEAYEEAKRALADLDSSIKGNALSQRQAILDIAEAQKELNLLRANPRASEAEIEQATIRFERESLGLEDLKRREAELKDERADATKDGLDGSDQVRTAQERLAAAQERVADTQRANARAAQDLEQARVDGARRIADAQQGVLTAQERVADAQRASARAAQNLERARVDGARRIADAQQGVVDAQLKVADAQARVADAERAQRAQQRQAAQALAAAVQGVVSAHRSLQQAQMQTATAGGAAMKQLNLAMGELSPTAQRFARYLYGLKGELLKLRAAASDGMLTGLMTAMEMLRPALPAIRDFIAQVSSKIGELFVRSAQLMKDPIFVRFFEYLRTNTVPMLETLFQIATNVAKGLVGLFLGFTPLTGDVSAGLLDITEKFADWSAGLQTNQGFQKFVQYMRDNAPRIGKLFAVLLDFAVRFVEAAAPIGEVVVEAFIKFFEIIDKIPTDALTGLIAAIAGIGLALSVLGSISSLLVVPMAALGIALGVGLVVAAIAAIASIKPLREAFVTAFKGIAAVGLWLWNNILKPIFTAIGGIFRWLYVTFLRPMAQVWGAIFGAIGVVISYFYNTTFKFFFGLIVKYFQNIFAPVIRWLWNAVFKPVFQAIGIGFKIFSAIVQVAAGVVQIAIKAMAAIFRWLYDKVIYPYWYIKIRPVFQALGAFIDKYVKPPFKKALEALSGMWNKWSQYFKVPLTFLVNTVLNGGLLGTYNKIAKFFGVTPDNVKVDLPKSWNTTPAAIRLASGGIMPGYTPGRDVHRFVSPTAGILELSGGEPVLRPEAGRVLGSSWVHGINAAARRGGTDGVREFLGGNQRRARGGYLQAFADGGFFDKVGTFLSTSKDKVGDFFVGAKNKASSVIGGVKDFITDPAGTVRKLTEKLLDLLPKNRVGNLIRNLPIRVMDMAIAKVKDLFNVPVGGSVGDITANNSPGFPPWPSSPGASRGNSGVWRSIVALIKSTGPMSGSFGNGYRPGDPLWHGSGHAVDWMGFNQDRLAQFLVRHRPLELIHRTNSRDYAYTRGRNKGSFNESLMNAHRNHIHIAMKLGGLLPKLHGLAMKLGGLLGVGKGGLVADPLAGRVRGGDGAALTPLRFDGGGWLTDTRNLPGQTAQVFHGRRQPDAVLSSQQWQHMATIARGAERGAAGPRVVNQFEFRDTTLTVDKLRSIEERRDALDRAGRPG